MIVTSPFTKRLLTEVFEVPTDLITVAMPGTAACRAGVRQWAWPTTKAAQRRLDYSPEGLSNLGGGPGSPFRIGLAADDRWAAGSDRAAFAELQAAIARHKLDDRIELTGALDRQRIAEAYAGADLFVLPSLFEGFGMVLTEAMARGLPIVCTTGGAAAETVPDDAALKVPPGAVGPLREALRQVIYEMPIYAAGSRIHHGGRPNSCPGGRKQRTELRP